VTVAIARRRIWLSGEKKIKGCAVDRDRIGIARSLAVGLCEGSYAGRLHRRKLQTKKGAALLDTQDVVEPVFGQIKEARASTLSLAWTKEVQGSGNRLSHANILKLHRLCYG